jgi:RNA polymerase sigma-70 factor (ECF subfamily)
MGALVDQKETEWIKSACQGDDDAFEHLVEKYEVPVYNLCYRMLGNPQEAEDAAQESFWRAYQAIKRYDTNRSFITWLLSIAAHYCIDQHRRRRLPTFALDLLNEESIPFITPGIESVIVRNEDDAQLHKLLDILKPDDRAILILRYWYEMSEIEIGEAMSLSISAVKSKLHRARKYLAQHYQNAQPKVALKEVV